MHVQSTNQERPNLAETQPFTFPKGIPGFKELTNFQLILQDGVFSLLQSEEEAEVAFILVDPFCFFADYEFEIFDEVREELCLEDGNELAVQCIVTWNSQQAKITANLLAPILFNLRARKGKQIVLQNTAYTTKHLLWPEATVPHESGDPKC